LAKTEYEKIMIPTPEGMKPLSEIIEKEVQARLETLKKKAPLGLRRRATAVFMKKLYNKGGLAKTRNELRKLVEEAKSEISKEIGKNFAFSLGYITRHGYIGKIEKTVTTPEGQKVKVKFYTYTPEAVKEFLPEITEKPEAPKEITPEEIEKTLK
jgi:hypothetical protein